MGFLISEFLVTPYNSKYYSRKPSLSTTHHFAPPANYNTFFLKVKKKMRFFQKKIKIIT